MGGSFSESFSCEMGWIGGGIYCGGTFLHGGLMIRLLHGQGSFTDPFSSNLKTVHRKMIANHEEIYTIEDKALNSQQNCEGIYS